MNISELAREAHGPITGQWWDMDVAALERFAALVRAQVLEEAAVVCDGVYYQHIGPERGEVRYGIAACAAAIRALKTGETK